MKSRLVMASVATLVAATLVVPPAAWSNGRYFFEDSEWNELTNTVYFGFVKDERKLPVKGAHITITVTGTDMKFVIESTPVGIYKSVDVPKDIDPSLVEVSVDAPGYKLVEMQDRTMTTLAGDPVQIDFLMEPDQTAAN